MKTKQSTLYRLSIALLTSVLLLCACVIVSQQRDIERLRRERGRAAVLDTMPLEVIQHDLAVPKQPDESARSVNRVQAGQTDTIFYPAQPQGRDPFEPVIPLVTASPSR